MSKPVTIIMIEDDEGHARLIERNIRRSGVNNEILPFTNGTAAVNYLFGNDGSGRDRKGDALLILLDLNLPDMTGIDILRRVKENKYLKCTPVVVLTTTDDSQEIKRCYELGCNVYITKPVNYESFANAIRQLGLKGILIHSNHKGHYPDDDEARPFWELVQDLDVPVFIHPPHVGFGEERVKEYRLASSVGRPADLCLALSRLIVRGVLEDFPRATIVGSHGGGGICEVIGRMDYAYELQDECYFLGSYAPIKIKHEPGHYLKRMYFDTVSYHPPAAQLVVDTVGPDHVLYGSDAPPLTSLKPRAIKLVEGLRVSDEDREKIFWRNAAKLLKLDVQGLG